MRGRDVGSFVAEAQQKIAADVKMPEGYTISEFIEYRFNRSKAATAIVTVTMIFGIILEILINLKGTSVVVSTVCAPWWTKLMNGKCNF